MIAVTGANGLLGSFIIRKLIEQQKPFIALKRTDSDITLLKDIADQITWRTADVLDPVALEEALQDITQVIHAAAIVSFNPKNSKNIRNVNVLGTRHVVNACLAQKIQRLVHISSVAALGRQKGQTNIDENNKWLDNSLNSTYAESKYLAELEVFRAQEEGLSTAIINPSVILAPADWDKSSAQLFKYVWNEKPFYIDGYLNFVDVRDVAEIAVKMLDSPIQASRFIVNAGNIPFIDFFRSIGAHFQKKVPYLKLNKHFLRIIAPLETIRANITRTEPLITRETAHLAGTNFSYNNEKVKKTLNFEFRTIDKTIEWCCQYYLSNLIAKK